MKKEMHELHLPILFVDVPYIQQQRGLVDCGVFAISFAVHLALQGNVTKLNFNQGQMRRHLLKCFQKKVMMPFPQTKPGPHSIPVVKLNFYLSICLYKSHVHRL